MAGRIDDATQEAAVARIFEMSEHHAPVRAHLEEILASSDFRGSRRSQEFLRRVVEYALEGDFDSLKERILGINIFGRDASYDTSEDSIVRVTASDVRRRLKQFYATTPSAIRIDLPAGSYIPVFQCDETAPPILASKSNTIQGNTTETNPIQELAISLPVQAIPAPFEQHATASSHKKAVYYGLFVIALFLILGIAAWLVIHRQSSPATIESSKNPSAQYDFYHDLLGPIGTDNGLGINIVLSNPYVLLYKGDTSPTTSTGNYYTRKVVPISRGMEEELNEYANAEEGDLPFHHLEVKGTSYTTMGEAEAAFHLRGLFDTLGRPSILSQARFLNWESARNHHIVLLGAPYINEWTKKNLISPGFVLTHDAVLNPHPLPGEQASYKLTFGHDWLDEYGVIWMSETPSGTRILVLAGLTGTGTGGVGAFLTDPAKMRQVYEKLRSTSSHGEIPPNWQALLHINARENVPLSVSLVTVHPISSK